MITLKTKHFKVVTSSIHPLIQQIPNFVQHFLKNEKHPFYELLSDCSKSCEKYVSSISEIERFMSMVDNNPDHLWDVTNKSTTQRKTVRGQSVSCTCNYSVTNFNSSSAQRLERDFEKSHHYLHDVLLKRVSKQKQSEIAMVNYFKNFMDTINLQDNHNNLVAMLDLLFYWLRETDHKMGGSSEWGLNLISLPTEWDAGSILYVKQLLECIINPISSALKDKSYYLNEKDFLKYLDYLPMNQVLQTLLLNWPRLIFDHEKTCNLIYTFAQIYTYGLIKITGRSSISKLLGSKLKLVILTFCHYLQKKHYSLRNNTNNQIIYPDPFAYYRNNNFYENDIDFSLFKKHFSSFSTLDQIFLDNMLINLIVLINKSKDRSLIKYFEPFPFHTFTIDLKEAENENENDNKNKKEKAKEEKEEKKKKTDPYNKVKSVKLHKWSNIKIPTEFSEFQFQRKLENSNNDNNNINNENNDEKEVTNNENDNENKKKENNKIDEEIIELENKENTNKFNGNFQINLNFDEFDNNNTTTNNNNTINNNNNTTTNNNITTTNNNNNTNDINTTTTTDINTTTTNTTNNNDTNIINENNNKEINIINENNDINIINENNTNENKEIEIEKSQENQNINDEIKTLEETLKPEELNLPIFLLPNIHIKLAILIMKFYFKSIYNNNDLKKKKKKKKILLYRIPLLINDNLNISLQEGNEKETEENQEEKKRKEKEKRDKLQYILQINK
ncbi:countin-like protein-related [Anaeramoeba flamelloides]|uniref:Countin-like protein-related n=1 Tax=Anaeramoeba flamelloides TaxID=1746091 RepID=A0AAV7YRA8_9EUKA|nr:countin-like protein-related [Anaeramoeba flamelloides]